jgi:hypothetical protein
MDAFKAEFKALFDKLSKYSDELEAENKTLREAINALLNEDDVKELPAYKLLQMTYGHLVSTSKVKIKAQSEVKAQPEVKAKAQLYDPLHAPPSARYGSKKLSLPSPPQTDFKRPLAVKQEESHYSSQMPDLNSCLLTVPKPKITPKKDETVYRVEIQGKNYLRFNDSLYDAITRVLAGKLADFKLGSLTEPVALEPMADFPGYYSFNDTVYILVNDEIAQAVGTISDGDLAIWS